MPGSKARNALLIVAAVAGVLVVAFVERRHAARIEYLEMRTTWMRGEIERLVRTGRASGNAWSDAYERDSQAHP